MRVPLPTIPGVFQSPLGRLLIRRLRVMCLLPLYHRATIINSGPISNAVLLQQSASRIYQFTGQQRFPILLQISFDEQNHSAGDALTYS